MKLHWTATLGLALVASIAQAASDLPGELKGSIAYATATNQYLLVYTSNEADSGPNIYGRVLKTESASPSGNDFRLSTQNGWMIKPVLAYNPHTQQFLVVWGRKLFNENRSEIVGLNVGPNGKIIGQEFRISFSDILDERPSIAYCPGRDRFLVIWERMVEYDFDNGDSDIYGQFVGGDGTTLQGSNFVIASAPKNQFKPEITCDETDDRFLALWEDQRNLATKDDVYGQLISSDGTMLGGNLLVYAGPGIERRPAAAANKDGTYLVVWESTLGDVPILLSRTIDSNGQLLGDPVRVGPEIGGSPERASVAYLKQQDVFLAVWKTSGFNGLGDGIYGQFFGSNGALRQTAFPLTTAIKAQYRPDVAAAKNTFLAVWTDYRDTVDPNRVYEYYGRVIGNDMELSSRWKNPESK
jgi:hypothetical protein